MRLDVHTCTVPLGRIRNVPLSSKWSIFMDQYLHHFNLSIHFWRFNGVSMKIMKNLILIEKPGTFRIHSYVASVWYEPRTYDKIDHSTVTDRPVLYCTVLSYETIDCMRYTVTWRICSYRVRVYLFLQTILFLVAHLLFCCSLDELTKNKCVSHPSRDQE